MLLNERESQRVRGLFQRVEKLEKELRDTNAYAIALEQIALQDIFVRNTGDNTITGSLDIIHTSTEADDHALELDVDAAGFGDVKAIDIDYITGAIEAGEDEGIILINIDEIAATGGDVFAVEVLATDGSADIYGLKAGALVGPIHQDSGTFANPTTGTDNTADTDVPNMIDGNSGTTTAIFEADNEYIIIGAAAAFQEIEFILTTPASVNIKPTFWYSTAGTGQFTQFTPVDGTNGFRNTGVIAWDASDLTGHVADTGTGTFDIKIIRTKNNLSTNPVLGYAKVAATTEYIWDKDGNLHIATMGIGTDPYSGLHYQGAILYLTPAAGAESNDNITIKNYATGNGAPDIILRTADINGAYGIGVGVLSLIGGSKTTHYGGIGGGGGEISLQGGQGRDASNNPSGYAPVLLQSNGGDVGMGTPSPQKDLHIESGIPTLRMSDDNAATDLAVATLIEFYRGNNTSRVGFVGMESSSNNNLKISTDYPTGQITLGTGSNVTAVTIDSSGNVGIRIDPLDNLHLYHATDDVGFTIQTDKVGGEAGVRLQNDARIWRCYVNANDDFIIRDVTGSSSVFSMRDGAGSGGVLLLTSTKFQVGGQALSIKERASAPSDSAGFGQLWVKNTDPCELWFTSDTGVDTQIV